METLPVNFAFLGIFILNFLLLLGWPTLSILALLALRKESTLTQSSKTIWALLIVLLPWLGALSFWIVRPSFQTTRAFPQN